MDMRVSLAISFEIRFWSWLP